MHQKKYYWASWSKIIMVVVGGLMFLSSLPIAFHSGHLALGEGTPNIPEVMKDGPGKVHPNEVFDYLISFTNEGDGTAENVCLDDLLPEYTIYLDSSPQGNYDPGTHSITWDFPTVQPSETINIMVTVEVAQNAPHGFGLHNRVALTYEDSEQNQYGPIYGDLISCVIAKPILDISCEAPVTADAGAEFTYMIEVFNKGYPSAIDVEVIDHLPSDAIYVDSNPPGIYNGFDHSVTWVIDLIEPDESIYLELIVTTNLDLTPATVLVNNVEVTWMVPGEPDPCGPESDMDSTTITGDWIIRSRESMTRSGELIVVTGSIIVENEGALILDNVKLQMKKPDIEDFGITILSGGGLVTLESTSIIAFSENDPYSFNVDGVVTFTDTFVSGLKGVSYDEGGITINAGGEFYCSKSKITSSETAGITVAQGATAIIDSSTIKLNGGDGIHAEGDVSIMNSVIEDNGGAGVYWLEYGGASQIELENVRIEENSIGIFCECLEAETAENMKLENIGIKNNRIDNIMMFNFKPLLRGGNLQIRDNTIVISSDTVSALPLPIKRDIQVRVLDSNYVPVAGTNVIVDDWEEELACNEDTNDEGFVSDIEVVEEVGTPTEETVPVDYLTMDDLEIMPYLNSYFEIVGTECRMRDGYYFNMVEEVDWGYEPHEIIVDPSYTPLEGYEVINPRSVIQASSSYDTNPGIMALDYDLNTYWSADRNIGSYELLIDLTDPQPIRYIGIYYQYVDEQSWFEGQSYAIEGYNEASAEWEEMMVIDDEENIPVREGEAPLRFWDDNDPSGWVSKVRMNIPSWTGYYDPGVKVIDVQDRDNDGLLNWYEISIGTGLAADDSDDDGMSDYYEEKYGQPKNPGSWFNNGTVNNRYAVLITTDDSYWSSGKYYYRPWLWNDVMLAYYMLLERGFTHSNIHFLYNTGTMSPNNNWISWYPSYNIVDRPATLWDIDQTFTTLASQITANDLLFVYLVNHGWQRNPIKAPYDGHIKVMNAPYPPPTGTFRNTIWDSELGTFMDRINPDARKVICINSCDSGTFIDDLSSVMDPKDRFRVISTSTQYNLPAWGIPLQYTYFGRYYMGALNWKYPNGFNGWTNNGLWGGTFLWGFPEDINKNGEISAWEAHMNDEIRDPSMAIPHYDDDMNPWDQFIGNPALDPDGPGLTWLRGPPGGGWADGPLGQATYVGGPHKSKPGLTVVKLTELPWPIYPAPYVNPWP